MLSDGLPHVHAGSVGARITFLFSGYSFWVTTTRGHSSTSSSRIVLEEPAVLLKTRTAHREAVCIVASRVDGARHFGDQHERTLFRKMDPIRHLFFGGANRFWIREIIESKIIFFENIAHVRREGF